MRGHAGWRRFFTKRPKLGFFLHCKLLNGPGQPWSLYAISRNELLLGLHLADKARTHQSAFEVFAKRSQFRMTRGHKLPNELVSLGPFRPFYGTNYGTNPIRRSRPGITKRSAIPYSDFAKRTQSRGRLPIWKYKTDLSLPVMPEAGSFLTDRVTTRVRGWS